MKPYAQPKEPLPQGFKYGNGTGNNDAVDCKNCGEPLIYVRMGDWFHQGGYQYCDGTN